MLILAGVSLNAIIGDNGIITNAQNAKLQSGLATLQEYVQELYVENFDILPEGKTALKGLMEASSLFQSYFYSSRDDFEMGDYLFDSEGNVIYVLKISALPKEIREQVVGGTAEGYATAYDVNPADSEAKDNLYYECVNKLDIYGVTSELKVYYCGPDGTMLGNVILDEANDSEGAIITTSTNYAAITSILTSGVNNSNFDANDDGIISVGEIRAVETLKLDANQISSLNNFSDFYAMTSLKKLYINYSGSIRKEDIDLTGLQNCSKLETVWFYNTTAKDYSYLARVKNLTHLIFYSINDTDLARICGTDNQEKRNK